MAIRPLPVILAAAALALAGCATPAPEVRTQEVRVEVPRMPDAPDALAAEPRIPELPRFVDPAHPEAAVALSPEGARDLRVLLELLDGRREAWSTWYTNAKREGD